MTPITKSDAQKKLNELAEEKLRTNPLEPRRKRSIQPPALRYLGDEDVEVTLKPIRSTYDVTPSSERLA